MTDFKVEFFRDEEDLEELLKEGPVTTTIDITPQLQFYGGGTFYDDKSEMPCDNILDEPVPESCQEVGNNGKVRYTCLNEGCKEQLPKHCDR